MIDEKPKQITEQETLDRILKFLVDNRSDLPISAYKIWKGTFPDEKEQIAYHFIKKLLNEDEIVISHIRSTDITNFDVFLEATDVTEAFLNNGGFQERLTRDQEEQAKKAKPSTIIVKYERHWYDTPLKILAGIETLAIIVCTPIALNIQSNQSIQQREIQNLNDLLLAKEEVVRSNVELIKSFETQKIKSELKIDSLNKKLKSKEIKTKR